ncbi:hypothetical protein ACJX0J_016845 [Zea mays]
MQALSGLTFYRSLLRLKMAHETEPHIWTRTSSKPRLSTNGPGLRKAAMYIDDSLDRYKTRLVEKGFKQRHIQYEVYLKQLLGYEDKKLDKNQNLLTTFLLIYLHFFLGIEFDVNMGSANIGLRTINARKQPVYKAMAKVAT